MDYRKHKVSVNDAKYEVNFIKHIVKGSGSVKTITTVTLEQLTVKKKKKRFSFDTKLMKVLFFFLS